jgi:hypothetical protein
MEPVINLDEAIGKVVGRTTARVEDYDRLVESSQSLMPRLPFPRGVYRFRTHQEADAWMEKYILQTALKKQARARQNEAT